jgi:REP element-mobilizing transposase RayT
MARPKRCEFQGAIHLVTLSGYSGGKVFYDPQVFTEFPDNPRGHAPDAEHFESLLWDTCDQYDARVHAYVVEPNAVVIAIQTHRAPLSWIVHDLLARYSMYVIHQNRIPEGEKPFPRRYKAQIVQPSKLPYAVRYVQRRERVADSRRRAINHPFSSHLIYCGRRPRPECFVVSAMREALENLGYPGPTAYFEFMARSDSPAIAHMLSLRIIGEGSFAESVRARCQIPPRVPSPDEILREVTGRLLHTEPSVACSSTHRGALARALVAWYAMRTGAAQIAAVGRWFGFTSSDLRYLIHQHRRKNPQYFSKSLRELFPALSSQTAAIPLVQFRDLHRPDP